MWDAFIWPSECYSPDYKQAVFQNNSSKGGIKHDEHDHLTWYSVCACVYALCVVLYTHLQSLLLGVDSSVNLSQGVSSFVWRPIYFPSMHMCVSQNCMSYMYEIYVCILYIHLANDHPNSGCPTIAPAPGHWSCYGVQMQRSRRQWNNTHID